MNVKSFLTLITVLVSAQGAAADEIFTYRGTSLSAIGRAGDYITASVTLDCTACLAGTYNYGTGNDAISAFTLSVFDASNKLLLSLTSNQVPDIYPQGALSLDAGGQIASWDLSIQQTVANEYPTLLYGLYTNGAYADVEAQDQYACFNNVTCHFDELDNSPGLWSSPEIISVPGPSAGAGAPGLIAAGCGLLWWRKRKRKARA